MAKILVAGVGNIFFGDDGFGVEVATALASEQLPEGVRVADFGIRGYDLAYAFLDGYDTVILVDATPRGGTPGQVYLIQAETSPAAEAANPTPMTIESHRMDPAEVLRLVEMMGGRPGQLLVVGCEPEPIDEEGDIQPGLSKPVRSAVPVAVNIVLRLVEELTVEVDSSLQSWVDDNSQCGKGGNR